MSRNSQLADKIYSLIPCYKPKILDRSRLCAGSMWIDNPEPRPDLTSFYDMGLLKVEQLIHGKYYLGSCRNASVARWNANTQLFRHQRSKFGSSYEEDINHPANDAGYDVFTAVQEVEPTEDEKVKEGFEDGL